MKLSKQELKHKEYLKLLSKLDELNEKLRKLPNIKLKKPYQQGWIIKYDVRPDIKRRLDYPIIKELIEKGWSEMYTNNVEVVRAIRQKKTQTVIETNWGSGHISNYYPHRNYISREQFEQLDLKLNKYYELDTTSEAYTRYQRKRYYLSVPSYWLVLKTKPFMITHQRTRGGQLESEYQKIRERVYWSGEFQSFITNYGKSFPKVKERTQIKVQTKKFLKGDVDDIFNYKIPKEYEY